MFQRRLSSITIWKGEREWESKSAWKSQRFKKTKLISCYLSECLIPEFGKAKRKKNKNRREESFSHFWCLCQCLLAEVAWFPFKMSDFLFMSHKRFCTMCRARTELDFAEVTWLLFFAPLLCMQIQFSALALIRPLSHCVCRICNYAAESERRKRVHANFPSVYREMGNILKFIFANK